MLRSLTAKQLMAWEDYSELEPFDEVRADYRAAQIVTMLANINRDTKKQKTAYKIDDFLLKFEKTEKTASAKRQTWQEQQRIAELIVMANNAAVRDGDR